LLLGIFSSTLLWRMQQKLEQGNSPYAEAPGYVIASSLALLTLYYAGLLLLAHQLWALLVNRKHIRRLCGTSPWLLRSCSSNCPGGSTPCPSSSPTPPTKSWQTKMYRSPC